MYRCSECEEIFEEPCYDEFCWEDYYGVGSMFGNRNYGTIATCPFCGAYVNTEEDYYYDEEE